MEESVGELSKRISVPIAEAVTTITPPDIV